MNNSTIVFMTTAKAKPGKEQEIYQALQDVAGAAREQPDCVEYRVFRSSEDSTTTVNFEQWSSNEAREAFLASPAVEKFVAAVSGAFAESPQVVSYEEVA
jgi:quinol monooxygenase YgiN